MTTLTLTQKIEAIQKAQDALRGSRWCQDTYVLEDRICATTALALSQGLPLHWYTYGDAWDAMLHSEVLDEIVVDMPMPTYPCISAVERICAFNNDADRKEDVIVQFEKTVARLARERSMERHPAAREMVAV